MTLVVCVSNIILHLVVTIQKSDPDVIVGHEFLGVSLDVLLGRMKDLRADHWSRIGRFRRTRMNLGRPGTNLKLLYGRLVCDLASDGAKVRDSNSFLFSLSVVLVSFP
jgi:DNA polymerase alpha subunit A